MQQLDLPRSDRLEFRRWRPSDFALAARLWQDAEVMRFLGGAYSDEQVRERLARETDNDRTCGIQYWPLFVSATGDHAGCCGLKPFDSAACEYEIGFHLLPQFWGGGYASEAARAVIDFAFGPLDAAALYAGHHPENSASRMLLGRLGFEPIGTHFYAPTGLDHPWYRRSPG